MIRGVFKSGVGWYQKIIWSDSIWLSTVLGAGVESGDACIVWEFGGNCRVSESLKMQKKQSSIIDRQAHISFLHFELPSSM